jgi:hypothetical protein
MLYTPLKELGNNGIVKKSFRKNKPENGMRARSAQLRLMPLKHAPALAMREYTHIYTYINRLRGDISKEEGRTS